MTATHTRPHPPAIVVRAHVARLLTQGMTRHAISADTGVCVRTLNTVLRGARPHVKPGTAAALLAAQPRTATENGFVPALGTIRRLRALVAFGHTIPGLARRSSASERVLWQLLHGEQPTVAVTTRNRVAEQFERLSATPGPSDQARRMGRQRHWPVPAAWEDIDDPTEDAQAQQCVRLADRRMLTKHVLAGKAHINLLTAPQQAHLWTRWVETRADAGLRSSARAFARQFGVCERRAARIRNAAAGQARSKTTTTAASECRTNERKAA